MATVKAAPEPSLFPDQPEESSARSGARPLADRMRPAEFSGVLGQAQVLGEGSLLAEVVKGGAVPSLIFWGPPGCGKTTLARLIAHKTDAEFVAVSAISANTAELRKIFERAGINKQRGKRTLLLVDEIHHFNRAQQDLFLPYVEDGTIILIGATTENPSFELNGALLSRCKVVTLERLDFAALQKLLARAENFTGRKLPLDDEARDTICALADGDGRYLLNLCEELLALQHKKPLDSEALRKLVQRRRPLYDKSRDGHYNLISALHKSLRGSDADAALYWFARMLDGGEEPLYIARRLARFASEDVGMADPQALVLAMVAKDAYDFLGSPEGELAIAQLVVYLATAPKSNAVYTAYKAVTAAARKTGSLMPPKHILNAPTKFMKEQEYGAGYQYDHDTEEGFSGQDYFPDGMRRQQFYRPAARGFEREIQKRLDYWQGLRDRKL